MLDPEKDTGALRRIQYLNDNLRRTFILGGKTVFSAGFMGLPEKTRLAAMKAISTFSDFNQDNDPYGEHDFVSVEVEGRKVFAKIDYYDKNLEFGSEDPSDPEKTTRVMTIMLAEDY